MRGDTEERELVQRATKGDKEAYRRLVDRYQKRAFMIALGVTRSHEDAEDIVQEAFVKAYLSLATFKGDSSFYTWLYKIVYNMSIDLRRRVTRRGGPAVEYDESGGQNLDGAASVSAPRFTSAADALSSKQQLSLLQQALEQLSDEHRTILLLREVDGLAYEEIAKALGISKGTVMSRLFYARKRVQRALMEMGGEVELPEGAVALAKGG